MEPCTFMTSKWQLLTSIFRFIIPSMHPRLASLVSRSQTLLFFYGGGGGGGVGGGGGGGGKKVGSGQLMLRTVRSTSPR